MLFFLCFQLLLGFSWVILEVDKIFPFLSLSLVLSLLSFSSLPLCSATMVWITNLCQTDAHGGGIGVVKRKRERRKRKTQNWEREKWKGKKKSYQHGKSGNALLSKRMSWIKISPAHSPLKPINCLSLRFAFPLWRQTIGLRELAQKS